MRLNKVRGPAAALMIAATGNGSQREKSLDYRVPALLPAAAEDVISVGALRPDGEGYRVAEFSNTFPRVSAPGVGITSAARGGGLANMSGTSMAAPHVAGVAALWWEKFKESKFPPARAEFVGQYIVVKATTDRIAEFNTEDHGVGLVQAPTN
jgi:subtilisin family serine protease